MIEAPIQTDKSEIAPSKYADWPTRQAVVYFVGAGQPVIAVKIGLTQASTDSPRA